MSSRICGKKERFFVHFLAPAGASQTHRAIFQASDRRKAHCGMDRLPSYGLLSSDLAMKLNCDLQLTTMVDHLYRLLATEIGQGYQKAVAVSCFVTLPRQRFRLICWKRKLWSNFRNGLPIHSFWPWVLSKECPDLPWRVGRRLQIFFADTHNSNLKK